MDSRSDRRSIFEAEALPQLQSLYRAALALTGSPSDAEDLVQETFQEAWKSFHGFRAGTDCRAWLFRILFRVRSHWARKGGHFEWVDVGSIPDDRLARAPEALGRIERTEIVGIVHSLPEHYRVVLVLADAERFSYREISEMLEVPLGTVMSRLNRARAMFREKYYEAGHEQRPPKRS